MCYLPKNNLKPHSTETTLLSLHDHLLTAIAINKSLASAFSTFLLPLTPQITQFASIVSHPGSVLQTLPLHGLKRT